MGLYADLLDLKQKFEVLRQDDIENESLRDGAMKKFKKVVENGGSFLAPKIVEHTDKRIVVVNDQECSVIPLGKAINDGNFFSESETLSTYAQSFGRNSSVVKVEESGRRVFEYRNEQGYLKYRIYRDGGSLPAAADEPIWEALVTLSNERDGGPLVFNSINHAIEALDLNDRRRELRTINNEQFLDALERLSKTTYEYYSVKFKRPLVFQLITYVPFSEKDLNDSRVMIGVNQVLLHKFKDDFNNSLSATRITYKIGICKRLSSNSLAKALYKYLRKFRWLLKKKAAYKKIAKPKKPYIPFHCNIFELAKKLGINPSRDIRDLRREFNIAIRLISKESEMSVTLTCRKELLEFELYD